MPHTWVCSISGPCDQEVGLLNQFLRFSYFFLFFVVFKTLVSYWNITSIFGLCRRSSVAVTLSNMSVIRRIVQALLQDRKFCLRRNIWTDIWIYERRFTGNAWHFIKKTAPEIIVKRQYSFLITLFLSCISKQYGVANNLVSCLDNYSNETKKLKYGSIISQCWT